MQFLSPTILWALAALAIPILLHLFYFRRFRKVDFSNVRFLKEIKQETQNRSRLRNLLVLAARLLAFAALILAFAQPFLPNPESKNIQVEQVGIFIDNSYSMSARASDVTLLEKAKQRAREILNAYTDNVEFSILTNELAGISQRNLSREDALVAIEDIKLSAARRDIGQILPQFSRLASSSANSAMPVFIISDFQESQFDLAQLEQDSSLALKMVPVAAVSNQNVSIDSVWMMNPLQIAGEPVEMLVRLTNHGSESAEAVRLSVKSQGIQQPFGIRSIPGQSSLVDTLRLSLQGSDYVNASVEITDFPVEYDDHYFISYPLRTRLKILSLGEADNNPFLESAIRAAPVLEHDRQNFARANYSSFGDYDLILLEDLADISGGLAQTLVEYVENGGKLLIFPGTRVTPGNGYSTLLGRLGYKSLSGLESGNFEGGKINTQSFVFEDVFERAPSRSALPSSKQRYKLSGNVAESLLSFRDDQPMLMSRRQGAGLAYLAAIPLDEEVSTLVKTAEVFVPMLYKMALSGGDAAPLAYTIGAGTTAGFALSAGTGEQALRLSNGEETFIPAQRILGNRVSLSFGDAPSSAGAFELLDSRDSALANLSFNYPREESPQSFWTEERLGDLGYPVFDGNSGANLEAELAQDGLGKPWWPWLIGLAIAALLIESLLLRFWSPEAGRKRPEAVEAGTISTLAKERV